MPCSKKDRMPRPIQPQFLYSKHQDVNYRRDWCQPLENVIKKYRTINDIPLVKARYIELHEPQQTADIQFHMDYPSSAAIPWAPVNIFVITGQLISTKWTACLKDFSAVLCFNKDVAAQLESDGHTVYYMEWPAVFELYDMLSNLVTACGRAERQPTLPPVLLRDDCPPISIITLIHNRRKFANLAFHNLLLTDYPRNKIEWVVVEDSSHENSASDLILPFADRCQGITITYIPLSDEPRTIGTMRNIGIGRAQHNIILFMDDDDHYPVTSFRRRVAWLLNSKKRVVACTMTACYDLRKGCSSVHVPALTGALAERISDATLTFYKDVWGVRPFPSVSEMEGRQWLQGRDEIIQEIPPQQIIVSFTHGGNVLTIRNPADSVKPGCFWGFPREFLEFIHGLVGVKVEEER
jgi:hypothetical protein